MRLRVLVGAAGNPSPVSSAPADVLENGVTGARWTASDPGLGIEHIGSSARADLLRVLQTRVGVPAQPLQQQRVRLPRRLCGPRLHQRRSPTGGDGFDEVIRWLRGRLPFPPAGPPSSERMARAAELVNVALVPACWELSYPGAGLGLPKPLPRRRREVLPGPPTIGPNDPNPYGIEPTPTPRPTMKRSVPVHGVHLGSTSGTYIAARSQERAVSLAARGYRNTAETHDGWVHPLPPGWHDFTYEPGQIHTAVLDLTGGAPSIELPEFDYMSIVAIDTRYEDRVEEFGVRLVFNDRHGDSRDAPRIAAQLAPWRDEHYPPPPLNLRIETDRVRRQILCSDWRLSGSWALFRVPVQ